MKSVHIKIVPKQHIFSLRVLLNQYSFKIKLFISIQIYYGPLCLSIILLIEFFSGCSLHDFSFQLLVFLFNIKQKEMFCYFAKETQWENCSEYKKKKERKQTFVKSVVMLLNTKIFSWVCFFFCLFLA